MKYAFKILRETATGEITLSEIMRVPDDTQSYVSRRVNYQKVRESLRVCDSRAEAANALEEEKFAASLYNLPAEERKRMWEEAVEAIWETGLTLTMFCHLSGVPEHTLALGKNSYPPNARAIAKIMLCTGVIREAMERMKTVLPGDTGPGSPWMGSKRKRREVAEIQEAKRGI